MPKGKPGDYNRYGDPKSGVKASAKKRMAGKKKAGKKAKKRG